MAAVFSSSLSAQVPSSQTSTKAVVQSGTLKDLEAAFDQNKAIFFLDVGQQRKDSHPDKFLAYINNYHSNFTNGANPINNSKLPYREDFLKGIGNSQKSFSDDQGEPVRGMSLHGTANFTYKDLIEVRIRNSSFRQESRTHLCS